MIESVTFPGWVKVESSDTVPYIGLWDAGSDWHVGIRDPKVEVEIADSYRTLCSKRLIWAFGREVIAAFSGMADPNGISDADHNEIAAFEADLYRGCSLTRAEGEKIEVRRRTYRAVYIEQWRVRNGRAIT